LHAVKRVGGDLAHHLERQLDDVEVHALAQQGRTEPERGEHAERGDGRVPCAAARSRTRRNGVDEVAGEHGREHVGYCGEHDERHNHDDAPRLLRPVMEGETEDVLEGLSAKVEFFSGHLRQPARLARRGSSQKQKEEIEQARR